LCTVPGSEWLGERERSEDAHFMPCFGFQVMALVLKLCPGGVFSPHHPSLKKPKPNWKHFWVKFRTLFWFLWSIEVFHGYIFQDFFHLNLSWGRI
jgi:hypothetical protein